MAAALLAAGCSEGADIDVPGPPRDAPLVRPDTPGNNLLFKFSDTDVVETYGSPGGSFLVHYTRQGPNAVPSADNDASGVPDFVEEVGAIYDEVLTFYRDNLGFRAPRSDASIADNGGDDRFDVYLVDFAGKGDGNYQNDQCDAQNSDICAGYMVQENDYVGYGYPSTLIANRILGSHEFFHAVQAAYDTNQGSVFAESTAVWATEMFDPSLKDFEAFLDGYLDNPDRSLEVPLPGPVDPFSYGEAIFPQFLEERYGAGKVKALWERCENGANGVADPTWFTELDAMLTAEANTSFAEAFVEFATWNLFLGKFGDPSRGYAKGSTYPAVKMDLVAAPFIDDKIRVFHASSQYFGMPPGDRPAMTAAVVGDASKTDGLVVLLGVQRGSSYDPVKRLADVTLGTETIDTAGADRLVTVVVNPLQTGDSKQPALCIGSVEEVAACRASFNGTGGGGGGGGGGSGGGGPSETGGEGGCGCRTTPSSPGGSAALFALATVIYFARARRRARSAPSAAR